MTVRGRLVEYSLVATIFGACLVFWVVLPLAALWIASKLSDNGLVVVFFGAGVVCPILMFAFGLVLARLNGAYLRAVGGGPPRDAPAWRSSLSGERAKTRRPRNVLETSLVVSVVIAVALLTIWFLFFAHSANPGLPVP